MDGMRILRGEMGYAKGWKSDHGFVKLDRKVIVNILVIEIDSKIDSYLSLVYGSFLQIKFPNK